MKHLPVLLVLLLVSSVASAAEVVQQVQWLPLTEIEAAALSAEKLHDNPTSFTPYNTRRPREPKRHEVFLDRVEYLADVPVAQALITFIGSDHRSADAKLVVEIVKGNADSGDVIAAQTLAPLPTPKVAAFIDLSALPPGDYTLQARLDGVKTPFTIKPRPFRKSVEKYVSAEFPADGVALVVHEQPHVPGATWPITTGIPLSRTSAAGGDRFVLQENGRPVAANFTKRSSWYPNGEQVQWMGLDFQARYDDNGKPREYRVMRLPDGQAAAPIVSNLKLSETPDLYTIDTGKIRFTVKRRGFNGIERAWLAGQDQPLIDSTKQSGGPFLIDSRGFRFEAANDESVIVEVEELGPARITIHAGGWYVSKEKHERLCLFDTRLTAWADQPFIDVDHRTVITYDTDKQKLGGLGFVLPHAGGKTYRFGADGKSLSGDLPAPPEIDPKTKKAPAEQTVWLHQDRWNHFRLNGGADDKPIAEGAKSNGWATLVGPNGSLSLLVRNLWQLYPKELEVGPQTMAVHFWPKHGHDTFTDEEELARNTIYRYFYAHEGEFLDLKFPQKYFQAMRTLGGGARMLENQDINALAGNGQGLAISNQFCIRLDAPTVEPEETAAHAALYQQNPHAIADPVWNGKSDAWGRFSAKDEKRFPTVEFLMEDGYRQNTTTCELLEEYGMWIWPDTHNNWSPVNRLAQWHRLWTLSHYQNVWESWLLYLRSGTPWIARWARDNSRHYMDVGTQNFDDPRYPLLGHMAGSMYHTKGFTPWGSPQYTHQAGDDYVELGAHFINPAVFVTTWQLNGDRTGKRLMETWGRSITRRVAIPPERSRENNNTLGELMAYYTATWDPQALVHIADLSRELISRPWREVPAANIHPVFNVQTIVRYWSHTRDPQMQRQVLEYIEEFPNHINLNALAYQWTGDRKYLDRGKTELSLMWQHHYNNPQDPLHGYGPRLGHLGSGAVAQKAPFYLQALLDAGIESLPADESAQTTYPAKVVTLDKPDNIPYLRDKSSASSSAYAAYLHPTVAGTSVELKLGAMVSNTDAMLPQRTGTTYYRVEDADGKVLLETTVLAGSQRPSATVMLNTKPPYRIYKNGYDGTIAWSGTGTALKVGPTPESVKP